MDTPRSVADTQAVFSAFNQQYLDACKVQYETSLQLLNAIVAGAERMREAQVAAARETQGQQRRVIEALGQTGDGRQLLALEGQVFSDYVSGCLQCWSKLAELAQQTQAELMQIVQRSSGRTTRGAKKV